MQIKTRKIDQQSRKTKSQATETDPEMTKMLELADRMLKLLL